MKESNWRFKIFIEDISAIYSQRYIPLFESCFLFLIGITLSFRLIVKITGSNKKQNAQTSEDYYDACRTTWFLHLILVALQIILEVYLAFTGQLRIRNKSNMFNHKSSICGASLHVTDAFVGGNDTTAVVTFRHCVLIDMITHRLHDKIKCLFN